MSHKKINIKSNPGPGLSEAFANPDYEIQPVMIEVWDGKRIAWAIAILIALILIPVAALLIDSYRKDSRIDTDLLSSETDPAEKVMLAVNESKSETRSAAQILDSQPSLGPDQQSVEVEHANDTVVVASTELLPADQPTAVLAADTEVKAEELRIEPGLQPLTNTDNSVVTGKNNSSEKPVMQSTSQPVLSAKPVEEVTKVEKQNAKMRLADLKKTEKTLDRSQVSQSTADTVKQPEAVADNSMSDNVKSIPPQAVTAQPGEGSTHVSRSRLVKSIENREPVGNEVDVINLSGGDAVRLYYFTEVNGMAGQIITYRWLYEGNLIYSKPVTIKGNYTWRSYIGKLIPASMSGNWMVEIVDSEKRQLASKSFQAL